MADRVRVERIGGFGGFGLPGSHLKSRGELAMSELSPDDVQAVNQLFHSDAPAGESMPDAFRYRITRQVAGNEETVEVPEHQVPEALKNSVKDTLE